LVLGTPGGTREIGALGGTQREHGKGKAVVKELADFIAKTEPNVRGFSAQNLWRMKQFYETYKDEPKLATLWREIPWSHQKLIMPCKTAQERAFYLQLTLKERLSFRELERQINASYYERVMLGNAQLNDVHKALPQDMVNVLNVFTWDDND
jgi:hypothetical protein